ncbi:MAG: alpha/beta hydrolase-fold protein, partial [Terracidiphilus sp.]
ARPEQPQDTGFLNRRINFHGATYRFQVYLPEDWRRDDGKRWPVILFLHGRGERGSEGMWQTQVGIAEAVRNHPDRWPFVIVMPQCPLNAHWTDPAMLKLAVAALDQESAEFQGDPGRTYLTGLSLGGYGAWELARLYPHRWAAIAIAAGGVFWSYEPDRWQEANVLPAQYARAVGHTPVWLFHGSLDTTVLPRQSELMFDAVKADRGNIRLWIYDGVKHNCWTRAFDEPELPRWLLAQRTPAPSETMAEFVMIPLHPPTVKLTAAQLDSVIGEYREPNGHAVETIYRQGDQLFEKSASGEVIGLEAESADSFFRPGDTTGARIVHLTFERDAQGRIAAYVLRDSRHEERWEKMKNAGSK